MSIDFPNTPVPNQLFVSGAASWRWDGEKWVVATGPPILTETIVVVTVTTALPGGFSGFVWAEPAAGPITITLPPTPTTGQEVTVKDTTGVAATRNITIVGASHNIEGAATLVLSIDYMFAAFVYTGAEWVQV